MASGVLVRYGSISEVARFANSAGVALSRADRVIVRTHRGIELGTLLEPAPRVGGTGETADFVILRLASAEDERNQDTLRVQCERQFADWRRRISEWKVQLELIDLESTLDKSKLILYVLNDRGAECTKLALEAAAAGLGLVEVQPVGPEGLFRPTKGHGCGSGGCGSDGNGGCCG